MRVRIPAAFLLVAAPVLAGSVDQAAAALEQQTAKLPVPLRIEFRMRAAQALAGSHAALSRKFISEATQEINAGSGLQLGPAVFQAFAVAAPAEGVALIPHLQDAQVQGMLMALARAGRMTEATDLYRQSLAHGNMQPSTASLILSKLVKDKPAEAEKLFRQMLAAAHFDTMEPSDTFRFLDCVKTIAAVAPAAAAEAADRIVGAAAATDYGAHAKASMNATFALGSQTINTTGSRDTILLSAGARLKELAPAKFAERKELFAKWDFSGPLAVRGLSYQNPGAAGRPAVADTSAIIRQIGQLRGLPTDADRAQAVLQIVHDIRALPSASDRVNMASSVANISTEGDLGKEALTAVAETLAQALLEAPRTTCDPYIQLASLVRFERLPAPKPDPALEAAAALIDLQEELHQEAGFTLTGLDGKTYSLAALRGHVVLLNFWATWCPPCRKEMPDMEKLYQRFQSKGLIVLAVSDEERETVANFEAKQKYSFPILLDPDRKVNDAFDVGGIPKSFLFDREGKLVAKAIDMRTEAQFLEMLKIAGFATEP